MHKNNTEMGNHIKIKSWIKYLIIISCIITAIFLANHIIFVMKKTILTTYTGLFQYNGIMLLFYGAIGLFFGLEHLIREWKSKGTWALDIPRLVLIGIPSLYFSMGFFIFYSRLINLSFLIQPLKILMYNSTLYIGIFQMVFGYTIITSFYKKPCKAVEEETAAPNRGTAGLF